MASIRLSPKHGVNPAVPLCYYCGESKNEILLLGRLKGGEDKEAPRNAVWDFNPCDKCKEYMELGVIIVGIRDNEPPTKTPFRTGQMVVVKEEALTRLKEQQPSVASIVDDAVKSRMMFMEESVGKTLGFWTKTLKEIQDDES